MYALLAFALALIFGLSGGLAINKSVKLTCVWSSLALETAGVIFGFASALSLIYLTKLLSA